MRENMKNKIWKIVEKMAYHILTIIFQVLKKELTQNIFLSFMQFIKFGIVGVSNTVVSYVLYVLSLSAFQKLDFFPKTDYLFAQAIAFILSVLWSFYWNNRLVFTTEENEKRVIWKTLLKTYAAYSFTGLFLNSILLVLWVQIFHISEFLAPLLNLMISVPLNFIINKCWAFK